MLEEKIEEDFLDSGEEIKRKYVTWWTIMNISYTYHK